MKPISRLSAAALALSLAVPAVSIAQPDARHDDDRGRHGANERPGPQRRGGPPPRPEQQEARDDRGAGPDHAFRRGGRLPPDFRSRQYVVDDWRAHHLSAPPRGYQWVQTGADYVLVAIASGLIAQVLLGH